MDLNFYNYRLMGLKLGRIRQWKAAVEAEARTIPLRRIAFAMGVAVLTLRWASKRLWRSRIKACMRCPAYNRQAKTCRPHLGSRIGCGCYMPFKAMTRKDACWAQAVKPGGPWGFRE